LKCIFLHNAFPPPKVFSFYIFTLLLLREPNKTPINKNKTMNFIGTRPFNSLLYLDSSRSFKCSPMVCLICRFVSYFFVLRENILKVHVNYARFEIFLDILINYSFKQVVDLFFKYTLLSRVIYINYIVI